MRLGLRIAALVLAALVVGACSDNESVTTTFGDAPDSDALGYTARCLSESASSETLSVEQVEALAEGCAVEPADAAASDGFDCAIAPTILQLIDEGKWSGAKATAYLREWLTACATDAYKLAPETPEQTDR